MSQLKEKAISAMERVREALEKSETSFVIISGVEIPREAARYLYEQLDVLKNNKEEFDYNAIPIKLLSADQFWRAIQIEINNLE